MKRMTLIAIALCVAVVATAGAGVVAAGAQPVVKNVIKFDVKLAGTDQKVGTLAVNLQQKSVTFTAKGLAANTQYFIVEQTHLLNIGSGMTDKNGNLRIVGDIPRDAFFRLGQARVTPIFEVGTQAAPVGCAAVALDGTYYTLAVDSWANGHLKSVSPNAGIPNREVYLLKSDDKTVLGHDVTDSSGYWTWNKAFTVETHAPRAYFPGDSTYCSADVPCQFPI